MKRLLKLALILAFIVVILGAWTRLENAGLSCPDWPTCYGQLIVPDTISDEYARPLESKKAWKEMIHRYAASILGLLTIIILILALKNNQYKNLRQLSIFLFLVVATQGALGAFTVTELVHPGIVSMHLLGGFITTALIFTLLSKQQNLLRIKVKNSDKIFLYLMILLVFWQIFLGGWTSTNYAALSCGNFFPSCLGAYFYPINFNEVFYWGELGIDYEYGILPESVRITIQILHRIGALIVIIAAILFIFRLKKYYLIHKKLIIFAGLLSFQVILGITNIVASLPILIAVIHNIIALFLLLSLLNINLSIKNKF